MTKTYVAEEKGKDEDDAQYFVRRDTVKTIVENGWVDEVVQSSAAEVQNVEQLEAFYSDSKPKALLVDDDDDDVLRIILHKYSSEVFVRVDSSQVGFEKKRLSRRACDECSTEMLAQNLQHGLCLQCRQQRNRDNNTNDKCEECGQEYLDELLNDDGLCSGCESRAKKENEVECERCGEITTEKKVELSEHEVCVDCERELQKAKSQS